MATDCISIVFSITTTVVGVCKKQSITFQNKKTNAHLTQALKILDKVDDMITDRERKVVLDLVDE